MSAAAVPPNLRRGTPDRCPSGHERENGERCRTCDNERSKRRRQEQPEKARASDRAYSQRRRARITVDSSAGPRGNAIRLGRMLRGAELDSWALECQREDPDSDLNRCRTEWTIRDAGGRYWRTRCVLAPRHDGRCTDWRGRRGPA